MSESRRRWPYGAEFGANDAFALASEHGTQIRTHCAPDGEDVSAQLRAKFLLQ